MHTKSLQPSVAESVVIRVVTTPQDQRGELLALFVHSRTAWDASSVVYSITHQAFRVEPYRKIMWRTRRATMQQVDDARDLLRYQHLNVQVLQGAPPLRIVRPEHDACESLGPLEADEVPAPHPDTKKDPPLA